MLKNEARPAGNHSVLASKQGEKCAVAHSEACALRAQSAEAPSRTARITFPRCIGVEPSTPGTLHGGRAKSSGRDDQRRNAVVVGFGLTTPPGYFVWPRASDPSRTGRHSGGGCAR